MLVCLSQIIVTAIVCLKLLLDMTATSNATVNNLGADIVPPPHFIVAISRIHLSMQGMQEQMATHSNILAWEIPWTEEPGCCNQWENRVRCK